MRYDSVLYSHKTESQFFLADSKGCLLCAYTDVKEATYLLVVGHATIQCNDVKVYMGDYKMVNSATLNNMLALPVSDDDDGLSIFISLRQGRNELLLSTIDQPLTKASNYYLCYLTNQETLPLLKVCKTVTNRKFSSTFVHNCAMAHQRFYTVSTELNSACRQAVCSLVRAFVRSFVRASVR